MGAGRELKEVKKPRVLAVEGKDVRLVKESDLLAVKGGSDGAKKEWETKESGYLSQIA